MFHDLTELYIDGILPKEPYPPCLRMAGYPWHSHRLFSHIITRLDCVFSHINRHMVPSCRQLFDSYNTILYSLQPQNAGSLLVIKPSLLDKMTTLYRFILAMSAHHKLLDHTQSPTCWRHRDFYYLRKNLQCCAGITQSIFAKILIIDTSNFTLMGKIWGVFCESKIWYMFCFDQCFAVHNIVLYLTAS